jgi:iron complex transport system permease protein
MSSGDEIAKGLGVSVQKIRIMGMIMAALVSALATAFHGVIAFIGLLAPHMARRLVGEDHYLLIPFSAVLGALLLLIADTLGRVVIGTGALPVGVITSFLGAPMFLVLLVRGHR